MLCLMKAIIFYTLLVFTFLPYISAQDFDNTWLIGYINGDTPPGNPSFGIAIMRFNDYKLSIEDNQLINFNFNQTNANISDENGNLLFYFNGLEIQNSNYQLMENGDDFNDFDFGYVLPQGGLVLPLPDHEEKFALIHMRREWIDIPGWTVEGVELFYSVIDMQENNGLGAVVHKMETIIKDTIQTGKITATKHANGRDWWILINESHTNNYYTILLDNSGPNLLELQTLGPIKVDDLGQARFTPDGSHYLVYTTPGPQYGQYLYIYDFDRCIGQLSNPTLIENEEGGIAAGLEISPNSRFVYVSNGGYVLQYDLWAQDIEQSLDTVAVYDGFQGPLPTFFHQAQLAPDGKIYISNSNGTFYLHVIHNPNEKGLACNVEQHGIKLPVYNSFSVPNHPNYRLGPIDGSNCDTLGIDNLPLAAFRYDRDTLDDLNFFFTDLSAYEPETWHWDFGDGNTSQDTSPVHLYDEYGVYEVCLTVSNSNASDTYCQTINIISTSTLEQAKNIDVLVYPNPAREYLNVGIELPRGNRGIFRLYNSLGQMFLEKTVYSYNNHYTFTLKGLPEGICFYEFSMEGRVVKNGKVMVME